MVNAFRCCNYSNICVVSKIAHVMLCNSCGSIIIIVVFGALNSFFLVTDCVDSVQLV